MPARGVRYAFPAPDKSQLIADDGLIDRLICVHGGGPVWCGSDACRGIERRHPTRSERRGVCGYEVRFISAARVVAAPYAGPVSAFTTVARLDTVLPFFAFLCPSSTVWGF